MITLKDFAMFSNELEEICGKNANFLGDLLLQKIQNVSSYKAISLSCYHQSNFKDVKVVGPPKTFSMKEHYLRSFQKKDPFAAHINTVCNQKENVPFLQSSNVFSKNYTKNEYYKYLHNYGFAWSLAMPIGNYRLTVYKESFENDFSDNELQELELLATIIKNKYKTQRSLATLKIIEETESIVADSLGVGVIVLDEHFTMQKHNNNAVCFLEEFQSESNMQENCYKLYNLLTNYGEKGQNSDFSISIEINNKKYSISFSMKYDSFSVEPYYIFTIRQFQILKYPKDINQNISSLNRITKREYEICSHVVSGASYQDIANKLFISLNTVRTHIRNAYKKLEINNQRELTNLFR